MIDIALVVLCGLLYRWGGEFDHNIRRWDLGIALAIYGMLHSYWLAVLCVGTSQLYRLPITLDKWGGKKGEIDTWQDWCWIPVLGLLYGLVPSPLAHSVTQALWMALLFSLPFTTLVVLSNLKTREWFKWGNLETLFGCLVGFLAYLSHG